MTEFTHGKWRGQRPKDLRDLKSLGIKVIIDLESGAYEGFHDDEYERQVPEDFDMIRFDIPCSDIFPPDRKKVIACLSLLSSDHPTYLHCLSGVDRTGFMVAAYRMNFQKWSFEDAHKEWLAMGRHWWFWWWRSELKKWQRNQ